MIFSISQGLRTPVIDDIASLAFECTLVGPVYPGDTIAARSTVSQVRRSRSSPACGIACLQVAVINHDWPTAWPGRRFPDVTERRGP